MDTSNVVALPGNHPSPDEQSAEEYVELPARVRSCGGITVPAIAVVRRRPEIQIRVSRVAATLLSRSAGFLSPESLPPLDVSLYLPAHPSRPRANPRCEVTAVTVPEPGTFLLTLRPAEAAEEGDALTDFCATALP